jgi:hypothetical protein
MLTNLFLNVYRRRGPQALITEAMATNGQFSGGGWQSAARSAIRW